MATYKTNRVILDPSKTSTSLKGIIQSSVSIEAIAGATILLVETGTKVLSNNLGEYEIKPIAGGQYTINISAPKYKDTVLKEVTIKQGQANKQDVVLELA